MKYYIIAGEASGDLHGATLMKSILKHDVDAKFRFWGGDNMKTVSPNIVQHYKNTSFMGFIEVLKNLKIILSLLKTCKSDILKFKPDVLILIDYPGFNLRICKWAHRLGIKVAYYIAPQVWAWKASRIQQMKKNIDRLFVILPFEKEYFETRGMPADYFGHPLVEEINTYKAKLKKENNIPDKCIACLPGSRAQEIKRHLLFIEDLASNHPGEQFVIAGVNTVPKSLYSTITQKKKNIQIIYDNTYALFSKAKAGIITSGTATLEACLFDVPQIVMYKGNSISYQIAKRLVKVKYISLVNLIADKPVIPELIQSNLNEKSLEHHFNSLMELKTREEQLHAYSQIQQTLSAKHISNQIAAEILNVAKSEK